MMDRMKIEEVQELLERKGWSKRHLATQLCLSEDAVYRWFFNGVVPKGPALVLMHYWLAEARKAEPLPAAKKLAATA